MENNLLLDYLTKRSFKYENIQRRSTLIGGLREVRKFAARNIRTGKPNSKRKGGCGSSGHWLSFIGYMSVLDQIGSCFKPQRVKGKEQEIENNTSGIIKAIKRFNVNGLKPIEINAMYALRNSIAHDYCLLNNNAAAKNKKGTHKTFHFMITDSSEYEMISVPSELWCGDLSTKCKRNQTIVNIDKVGGMVENIYQQLIKLARENKLEFDNSIGGIEGLLVKYTFGVEIKIVEGC